MFIRCCILAVLFPAFVNAGSLVQFRSFFGTMDVELFDQDKPVTVQNFLRYVESGAYEDLFYHRWIPGFVMQGGGLRVMVTNNQPQVTFVQSFGDITNEFSVGRRFNNVFGTLSMARRGTETNSGSSEWFFNTVDNPELDTFAGGYTVFGRVIEGTNFLRAFNNPGAFHRVSLGSGYNDVPALTNAPTFNDLIYVDITTLRVQIQKATNAISISFNSITNRTHRVQYTTNYPPVWHSLTNIQGNGLRLTVTDPSIQTPRFYRVKVDYPGLNSL